MGSDTDDSEENEEQTEQDEPEQKSDDEAIDENQDTDDQDTDTAEQTDDSAESGNEQDDPADRDRDESTKSTNPFLPSDLLDSLAKFNSLIDDINFEAFQITIDPEVRKALTQPVIDPEVIRQLQQPMIDPEVLEAMQEPLIDPEVIEQLSEPAIDPELLNTLESLDEPALVDVYESAATAEQVEQQSVEEIEETSEDEVEPPERGGFLSTFFNATAIILLQQEDRLPEESVDHLNAVLESESVQEKSDHFRQVVQSVKDVAAQLLVLAAVSGYQLTWGLHFADEIDEETEADDSEK